jgi:hypothetical protein
MRTTCSHNPLWQNGCQWHIILPTCSEWISYERELWEILSYAWRCLHVIHLIKHFTVCASLKCLIFSFHIFKSYHFSNTVYNKNQQDMWQDLVDMQVQKSSIFLRINILGHHNSSIMWQHRIQIFLHESVCTKQPSIKAPKIARR